jgi:hypothetical protein
MHLIILRNVHGITCTSTQTNSVIWLCCCYPSQQMSTAASITAQTRGTAPNATRSSLSVRTRTLIDGGVAVACLTEYKIFVNMNDNMFWASYTITPFPTNNNNWFAASIPQKNGRYAEFGSNKIIPLPTQLVRHFQCKSNANRWMHRCSLSHWI